MPFAQSPYYTNPAAGQIAGSLATALFGDPALRQKQALSQAEMDQRQAAADAARAQGGFYRSKTVGQNIENGANRGLPATIAALYNPPPPPEPVPQPENLLAPPAAVRTVAAPPSNVAPDAPAPVDPRAQFHAGLPAVIAAMAQGGHGADIDQAVRAAAAFAGGDGMARRALVAGGASPSKDFAITPERADQVAQGGYDADYRKATGVAAINAGARRYAADRQAAASEYGSDQRKTAYDHRTDVHWVPPIGSKRPAAQHFSHIVQNAKGQRLGWNGSEWVPAN